MKTPHYIVTFNALVHCCIVLVCITFICSAQQLWTTQSSPTHCILYGITWGNNTFVAVGDSGNILTSPDGIAWTLRNSGTTNILRSVAWGANKFVAVGHNDTRLMSPDGILWTIQYSVTPKAGLYIYYNCVAFSCNKFLLTENCGYYEDGMPSGTLYSSTDGIIFTEIKSVDPLHISSASFGANENTIAMISDSKLLCKTNYTTRSTDTNWSTYSPTKYLNWGSWCKNCFIVVGDKGAILTSPDAQNWTQQATGSTSYLYCVTCSANANVAVGDGGTILTAKDSATWVSRTSGTTRNLNSVVYGNNKFVAVGDGGTILTSIVSAGTLPQQKTSVSINNLRVNNKQIYYTLSSSADVVVQVFNTQGQLLRTLLNAWKEQGTYNIGIPAAIRNGRYIISYKAGTYSANKAIVINN